MADMGEGSGIGCRRGIGRVKDVSRQGTEKSRGLPCGARYDASVKTTKRVGLKQEIRPNTKAAVEAGRMKKKISRSYARQRKPDGRTDK